MGRSDTIGSKYFFRRAYRFHETIMNMADDESIVAIPRERFSDLLLPESKDELAKLMDQPAVAIVEILTGAVTSGPKDWMARTGHIVQAILTGKLHRQFAQEIKELRDKGKILPDFADERKSKYGFQSWAQLVAIIDEEAPDADRLEALKAMFFGVNRMNATDGERMAAYQLFQIAKKLSSGQLVYLKVAYEMYKNKGFSTGQLVATNDWLMKIGNKIGHHVIGLLDQDDLALIDAGLVTERRHMDKSGVMENDARLTSLGIAFCRNIETYQMEMAPGETV
jgi:hypothetical protein